MEIGYSDIALEHLAYWKKSGNIKIQKKINQLLQAIEQNPFEGIGKPEQLKHELTGKWSRRITNEHRLVYEVRFESIIILALKWHYV